MALLQARAPAHQSHQSPRPARHARDRGRHDAARRLHLGVLPQRRRHAVARRSSETAVVQGLYRYVRNPMYLAVSTILLGEALLVRSSALLLYWIVFFTAANLFVLLYEEPTLRRQFGESYERYTRTVGRWLPRPPR